MHSSPKGGNLHNRPKVWQEHSHASQPPSPAGAGGGGSEFDTGRRTYPLFPKGFKDCSFERNGDDAFVAEVSARRDQPKEFICDRNESDAMMQQIRQEGGMYSQQKIPVQKVGLTV